MDVDEALDVARNIGEYIGHAPARTDALLALAAEVERLHDAWAPVPRRWADIEPGDTFFGAGPSLWHVERIGTSYGAALEVVAVRGNQTARVDDLDPDETVDVLVPVLERDSLAVLHEQLGAQPLGRTA